MDIIKEKVIELMNTYCNGNYNAFARELHLEPAHVYRTLVKKNTKAGPKFLGAIMIFCDKNNLNARDYIFFDKSLTTCNK